MLEEVCVPCEARKSVNQTRSIDAMALSQEAFLGNDFSAGMGKYSSAVVANEVRFPSSLIVVEICQVQ